MNPKEIEINLLMGPGKFATGLIGEGVPMDSVASMNIDVHFAINWDTDITRVGKLIMIKTGKRKEGLLEKRTHLHHHTRKGTIQRKNNYSFSISNF